MTAFRLVLGLALACLGSCKMHASAQNGDPPLLTPYALQLQVRKHLDGEGDLAMLTRLMQLRWEYENARAAPLPVEDQVLNPADGYPTQEMVAAYQDEFEDWADKETRRLGDVFLLEGHGLGMVDAAPEETPKSSQNVFGRSKLHIAVGRQASGPQGLYLSGGSGGQSPCLKPAVARLSPSERRRATLLIWDDLAFVQDRFETFNTAWLKGGCWGAPSLKPLTRAREERLVIRDGLPTPNDKRFVTSRTSELSPDKTYKIQLTLRIDDILQDGSGSATAPGAVIETTLTTAKYFEIDVDHPSISVATDGDLRFNQQYRMKTPPPWSGEYFAYDVPLTSQAPALTLEFPRNADRRPKPEKTEALDILGLKLGDPLATAIEKVKARQPGGLHLSRRKLGELFGDAEMLIAKDASEFILLYHNSADPSAGVLAIYRIVLADLSAVSEATIVSGLKTKYGPSVFETKTRERRDYRSDVLYWVETPMALSAKRLCARTIGLSHGKYFNAAEWTGDDVKTLDASARWSFRLDPSTRSTSGGTFGANSPPPRCGPQINAFVSETSDIGRTRVRSLRVALSDIDAYVTSLSKTKATSAEQQNPNTVEVDF